MFNFEALKKYFDDNGLKQKFVAPKSGIAESTLSAILTGKRKCSLDEYIKLCQCLAVPFATFIDSESVPAA